MKKGVFIIKNYFKFAESYAEFGRIFLTEYGTENCASNVTLENLFTNFWKLVQ